MSPTSKLAKRREGVGEESDDKLDSSKMSNRGDGGGVVGGAGEALGSWYIPHSLFVGSAAPAHVTMASLHLFSHYPSATAPHPPVSSIHSLLFTLCSHSSWAFPQSWQLGEVWWVPTADTLNIGIGHNSFECDQVSCISSIEGGGRWCIGRDAGGG